MARSSGTACSSAAQLRIRPALISDNAKLIRMRAAITAEKMLPNQEGKQPEGPPKHLGLLWALQADGGVRNTEDIIHCMVIAMHFLLLLGLVYKGLLCILPSFPVLPRRAEISKQCWCSARARAICFSEPLPPSPQNKLLNFQ